MKDNTKFIQNLVDDMKPIKPLLPPTKRVWVWLIPSYALVAGIMFTTQTFRPHFLSQLTQPFFLFETLSILLAPIFITMLVFQKSVPGLKTSKLFFAASAFLSFIFLFLFSKSLWGEPSLPPSLAGARGSCFHEVLILSWIPILAFTFAVRKGYVYNTKKLAFMIGLSGALFPAALMQVACVYIPNHVLYGHLVPAAYCVIAFTFLGGFVLKPNY